MVTEKNIIEMDMLFKLYILSSNDPEVHAVNIYKDNKDKNGYVKLNETKYSLDLLEVVHLRDYVCSIKEVGDSDKSNLKLWKVIGVKRKDIKNQNISTEEGIIHKLKGNEMDLEELFSNYFQDELNNKNKSGSSIITIIPASTELGRKRLATEEEENREQKRRKWETNGAIRKAQREAVYFVDPLPLSNPLLDKIREGDFTAMHGARASGKSTRVLSVMEQLSKEGYLCIYVSLEIVDIKSEDKFWTSFGGCLARNAPDHIKVFIKSAYEFNNLFMAGNWEKKVVLFIDEFDKLTLADDDVRSSFLSTVRGIKTTKHDYAIWSINAIGPFSILFLGSSKLSVSPFNVREPFRNSNFTLQQVQLLFKEFMDFEMIEIESDIIDDIYKRTNGHAGLVCLCGKAIQLNLMAKLKDSKKLELSTWLDFTAENLLEEVILNYPTFQKLVDTLVYLNKARDAVDLLRHSFVGFLGSVKILDLDQVKLAHFLTAEGVLTDLTNNTFRMSSAFMDELIRRRVIPTLFKSSPESAVPKKDGHLDVIEILQTAIRFFDKDIIFNASYRSFKTVHDLYVDGKKKKQVPRESVYDTELNRILINWLSKMGDKLEITGQWHLIDVGGEDAYSDIVITIGSRKIILELLATATRGELDKHFERVLEYGKKLSTDYIWIVHFTREDYYGKLKAPDRNVQKRPHWPSNNKINTVHFFHDEKFKNVLMNAQYVDNSSGNTEYIKDKSIHMG